MKGKRDWVILLVLWCALLTVQLLSYVDVLHWGKLHPAMLLVGVMGILNCIWHLKNGD